MQHPVDQGSRVGQLSDAKPTKVGFGERIYPAAKLVTVVETLAVEGISPTDILRRAQVPLEELHSPATRISLNQIVEALLAALELSQNAALAYKIGSNTHVSARGMYGYALLCCTNFRRTIEFAVKYHQLAAPIATISFGEKDQSGFWTIDPVQHPKMNAQLYRFVTEMQIGTHISLHRDVMGDSFSLREILVTYSSRESGLHTELVGCPVLFEQSKNQIIFDAAKLDGAPVLGNRATFATVTELCDDLLADMKLRTGVAGRIRDLLLQDIQNRPTFANVARRLGMSGRTIRRQLQQEGITFRELVDELRLHVAMKYLQETEMTNEDIAFALGFSDAANFRHAFRRWTKKAPREFRRRIDTSYETR